MTIHDRVQELVMSLAVDEVTDADRELAERHLMSCEQCRADLDSLASLLPLLPQFEDPVGAPETVGASDDVATPGTVGSPPGEGAPPAVERTRRHRHRLRRRILGGVVAAVVAASLVVALLVLDRPATRHEPAVALSANGAIRGGDVWFEELDDGVIVHLRLTGLNDPPPGGMYEAWLELTAGGVMSVGSFSPDRTGDVSVTLHGAGHLADFAELMVTIEPDMVDPELNGTLVVVTDLPLR